jgi:dihydropyrimidinase
MSHRCLGRVQLQITTKPVIIATHVFGRDYSQYVGTRSAIAGGTTTLITFAPQKKSEPSLLACLEATHARARNNCYADYSFHLICSNAGTQAISEFAALREAGISSLKIYMTYEALQLNDSEILDVLFEARKQKIVGSKSVENFVIPAANF